MSIPSFLGKLLNVRSDEWRRLSILYCMSLVALTCLMWADAIVQAAFLQRVGVQYLPWVIISCAACSIVALFIYFAFADRVSNTRILIGLFVISAAGILLGLAALAAGLVGPAYLLLYLVLQVPLLDVYNVHWATYVNGFYDIRTAKRIVPVLATTARLAGIIAGLSMPLMNRLLSSAAIIALSMVGLAITGTLALLMPWWMHEQWADRAGRPRSHAVREARLTGERQSPASLFFNSYAANLSEGYQQIRASPFLLAMALSTLSMTILLALLNYRTSAIFLSELKTTVAISDFIGVLTGVANLVVLPFQLFVLSRLIARLGLGNANLIYPMMSLATAGSLVAAPGLAAAALGYLDRAAFRTAFRIPTDNLLYNAVPQRVKARTRAFVGGLVVPIGAIVGGLLLLTPLMRTSWFLPAAILLLAIALTVAGLMVRRHYGKALVDLLEQEEAAGWQDFSLPLKAPTEQEPSTLAADPVALTWLGQKLDESTSPERTLFMAQLLVTVGGEAAVPLVAQAAHATDDRRLRALLVDVLVAADLRRDGARELYRELLCDPDARVRLSAISGLEQIDGPRDRRYLDVAAHLLADPDIDVRLHVLPALLAAGDPLEQNAAHAAASAELRALLKSPDPHIRARAVRVIGQARAFGFLLELVRSLTDAEDEVRLAAGLATETLANDESLAGKRDILLALALLLMYDPVERARVSAFTVLDRLSTKGGASASAARESSVAGLADPSSEVRERAVEILVRAGRRALPSVREQLDAADAQQRKMAAVVLARIEPRKYSSLVLGAALSDNLCAIYQNLACLQALTRCLSPAAQALGSFLWERNADLLDEIFYLLTAIRDPDAVETIARSLRSPQPEVRANAVEALESLTAPQTAALIGPLLEPDRPSGPSMALARQTWELSVPNPVDALRLLLSDASDTWQRTLAAAALAELSTSVDWRPQQETAALLELARADPDEGVRAEACVAGRNQSKTLSLVGRLLILKELPFFTGMRMEQLRALAGVCEEQFFPADTRLFNEGDRGGVLYAVVSGRVGIEQEKRRGPSAQHSFARLATIEAHSYLGESDFFDGDCRTNSALAIEDTLTLKLRREPLVALARRQPDLSLELINVLSDRLREANERIAELTRTEPERLLKLYDELE